MNWINIWRWVPSLKNLVIGYCNSPKVVLKKVGFSIEHWWQMWQIPQPKIAIWPKLKWMEKAIENRKHFQWYHVGNTFIIICPRIRIYRISNALVFVCLAFEKYGPRKTKTRRPKQKKNKKTKYTNEPIRCSNGWIWTNERIEEDEMLKNYLAILVHKFER